MSAASFCTVTASTKRGITTAGRTAAPTSYLASILITPLWPVSAETVRTMDLNSPREMKEAYHVPLAGVALPDVKEGDVLTVGGVDYPVYSAAEWTDGDVPTLHIVVQQVK
jgi:hypothetical protein